MIKPPFSPRVLGAVLLVCLVLLGSACADAGPGVSGDGPIGAVDLLRAVTEAKGKVVIINFWASWCQPCRREIPELMEVRKAFGEHELYLLGVSVDRDKRMYEAFVDKAGFNYPVGLGHEEVLEMFQVSSVPTLVVYDTKGRLVANEGGLVTSDSLSALVRSLLGG